MQIYLQLHIHIYFFNNTFNYIYCHGFSLVSPDFICLPFYTVRTLHLLTTSISLFICSYSYYVSKIDSELLHLYHDKNNLAKKAQDLFLVPFTLPKTCWILCSYIIIIELLFLWEYYSFDIVGFLIYSFVFILLPILIDLTLLKYIQY